MTLGHDIIKKAQKRLRSIALPESTDPRILQAAEVLARRKIVQPLLVGKTAEIQRAAKKAKVNLSKVMIVDVDENPAQKKRYALALAKKRAKKGMTQAKAMKVYEDPVQYAAAMVAAGEADGMVSGAVHATSHTLRAALWNVGLAPRNKIASSFFIMEKGKEILFFADCGFNINLDAAGLAEMAVQTAHSAQAFGTKPRVAMLSFSTKGSASHPDVDKVVAATKIVKKKLAKQKIVVDGELQFDAAYVPGVQKSKAPKSALGGKPANTFIFPDLDAGNIAYKITQRLGGYAAYGPIVQGLSRPINDLSRGCNVNDIVEVAAITSVQAK